MLLENKLECFSIISVFQAGLMFGSKKGFLQSGALFDAALSKNKRPA